MKVLGTFPEGKWDARYLNPAAPHDRSYYMKCQLGGVLSCGLTHMAVTPLDVVKCNMQVDPRKYTGLFSGGRLVLAEEGVRGLLKGWLPCLVGYSMQGFCKFGFYEIFKDLYMNMLGEDISADYTGLVWLAGSASAEFIADVALCPLEMVKVKIQTSPPGTFPTAMMAAMAKMSAERKTSGFPFGSLVPLWSRQIPYTMAKFYFFELVVSMFYTHVLTEPKSSYSKQTQLGVTFASGYIAGVVCAIVSHPADNLVSLKGKESNAGKSFSQIATDVGAYNLATKGLAVRILMIGTLTGLQWWIYDSFKTSVGLGTSGGKPVKRTVEQRARNEIVSH
ncbi:Mitochondrial phosphate carrier protein 3 [Diplonema papillatum]|nr:Mitochondrial phosphate carrier protein 3 [Diplonema papillatum]